MPVLKSHAVDLIVSDGLQIVQVVPPPVDHEKSGNTLLEQKRGEREKKEK
jgi:hypothetical protein